MFRPFYLFPCGEGGWRRCRQTDEGKPRFRQCPPERTVLFILLPLIRPFGAPSPRRGKVLKAAIFGSPFCAPYALRKAWRKRVKRRHFYNGVPHKMPPRGRNRCRAAKAANGGVSLNSRKNFLSAQKIFREPLQLYISGKSFKNSTVSPSCNSVFRYSCALARVGSTFNAAASPPAAR